MLLHHDDIHRLGILEGQKPKPARPARRAISHDGALDHLPKGGKVVAEGLVGGFPVETADEHFSKIQRHIVP